MEYWFTYELLKGGQIVRKGKGHCEHKSADSAESYLKKRYRNLPWDEFIYSWHASESAAFKGERRMIDAYLWARGELPPWNDVRGGGGGQTYVTCRAITSNGKRCQNLAIAGNYGYCRVHRR
jgi:hypothetical protein